MTGTVIPTCDEFQLSDVIETIDDKLEVLARLPNSEQRWEEVFALRIRRDDIMRAWHARRMRH